MILLAVDPGGTTGWAKFAIDEEACASGSRVADCVVDMAYGEIPFLSSPGDGSSSAGSSSAGSSSFSTTAGEERVARQLYDLAVGPAPSRWTDKRLSRRGGGKWVFDASADCVVFEDFVLREASMGRALLSPVRMTSAFRGMAWIGAPSLLEDSIVLDSGGSVPRWSIQSPSDGKSIVTKERLRKWKTQNRDVFWIVGQQHARDAIRHGLLWILKNQSQF